MRGAGVLEMSQSAFAAVCNGIILTNTLSDTVRAAKVNWLVTEADTMVFSFDDDETINNKFNQQNARFSNSVSIKSVAICVSSGTRK